MRDQIDVPAEGADAGRQGPVDDICVVCGAVVPDEHPLPGYRAIWGDPPDNVQIVGWTCSTICTAIYRRNNR